MTASDGPASERPEGADALLRADLTEHGLDGEVEHLWGRQVADHRYVLCSVPLFAYGMTCGDEVQVDNDRLIKSVTQRSGNLTLRMSTDDELSGELRERVAPLLEQLGLPHEWQGDGYVAILVDESGMPGEIFDLLDEWPKATRPEWELF